MNNSKLPLKDLCFGKTDAYNELLESGAELFERFFWQNDQYSINDFLKGSKYYIYGDKGTGKTAFLKYLECILSNEPENLVIPIRYKTEFGSDDKKILQRAAVTTNNIKEEVADISDISEVKDCIASWQLYLISRIIKGLKHKGEYQIFEDNKEYSTLYKLIESIYADESHRIIPQINKGMVSVNLSALNGLSATVGLEIGLEKEQKRVNYQKLAKKVVDLFSVLNLVSSDNSVWVLFDELELSVQSKKMNNRDITLVRDLILAIERLNDICRNVRFPVHIIASIRSEVINSVYTSGYEINKPVEDFGKEITWYIRGGSYEDSPLISMIMQRIRVCEENVGIKDNEDLWYKYFPRTINGLNSKEYILRYTWHRPRDIVRMLNLAKENARDSDCFTQDIFDATMRSYSKKSWNEIAEELSLIYDSEDLNAIKKLFTNIGVPFTLGDLNDRLKQFGGYYDYVKRFNERHKLISVLEQLFNTGVIGNSGQRMRFKFLKDDDLDPSGKMIIHTPLRNYFAVQSNKSGKVNNKA